MELRHHSAIRPMLIVGMLGLSDAFGFSPPMPINLNTTACQEVILGIPQSFIEISNGSELVSIPANKAGPEEVAYFQPENMAKNETKHVFIVVHGKLSDAGLYWRRMDNVINVAHRLNLTDERQSMASIAPVLFSDIYTPSLFTATQLSWADPDIWQSGLQASNPVGTKLTAVDALEALVDEFTDQTKYPLMTNITFVGHSGGGQLVQRFAAVARDRPSANIHIRYIQNNPFSCSYFTDHRPTLKDEPVVPKESCPGYDTWKWGFEAFSGTADGLKTPQEYFQQYVTRDVVSTVGYRDTNSCSSDQNCMAMMQGGGKRRDRNLIWYKYVNMLARTSNDVTGFPGNFSDTLPDWGYVSNNTVRMRLVVAEKSGHEFSDVFLTNEGLSAIFGKLDILPGWRP